MDFVQSNISSFRFFPFNPTYSDKLVSYLNGLSNESKSRFGPHPFNNETITALSKEMEKYKLYLAVLKQENEIAAYTIIRFGWNDFDSDRLSSNGLKQLQGDCTLAPSVADKWQGQGLGSKFLGFVLNDLKTSAGIRRVFLWGGVQNSNARAINFYKKFGFQKLSEFEHNGKNLDMLLEL